VAVKVKVGQNKNVRLVATSEKRPVIVPDSIALGVDTVGEYVRKLDAGQGIIVTPETDTESANLVISHANTTTEVSSNNGLLEFVHNTSIDQFGHVTGLTNTSLNPNQFFSSNNTISLNDITFGNTSITIGESTNDIEGLDSLEVGDFTLSANAIVSTANVVSFVATQPLAVFDFGTRRLVNVDNPIDDKDVVNKRYLEFELDRVETTIKVFDDPILDTDATNKRYVDNLVQGLRVRPAALAATTEDLNGTFDNGNTTIASTITLDPVEFLYVDDVTSWELGDNLLVKDQNNPLENGSYELIQEGNANTAWVFQRTSWSDKSDELPGSYEFVTDGTVNGGTGWVATVADAATFNLNTDGITWTQFQGEGTYTAGTGLSLNGTQFNVNESQILSTINPVNDILTISGDGALTLPKGDSANRPTAIAGMVRFNSEDGQFEGYDGVAWSGLGGVIDLDQDTKIAAENNPGDDNDELKFYTGGTLAATFSANTASFTGDVDVAGNVTIGGNITIGDQTTDSVEVVADFTSDLLPRSSGAYSIGAPGKEWFSLYVNSIKSEDGIITLSSRNAVSVPTGETSERPSSPTAGMFRFNVDENRFEGYDGTQWSGLAGSVIDLDRNTYIIAETSAGANNNELDFWTDGTQRMQIGDTGNLKFGSSLDDIVFDFATGNLIVNSKVTSDADLVLDANGSIDVSNNIITGLADPVNPSDAVNLGYLDNTFSSGLTIEDTENANTIIDGINLLSNPTLKLGSGIEAKSVDTANNELEIGLTDTGVQAQVYGNDRFMPRIRVTSDGRIDFATEIPVELQANAIPDFTETSRDIIALMFTDAQANGAHEGVNFYHDDDGNQIYAVVDNFDIIIDGDLTGSATVNRLSDTTITASITTDFVGQVTPLGANSGILITETYVANTAAKIDTISVDHDYMATRYQTVGGDYTASRFVDADNTNFYVDPHGTSRINQMEVGYGSTFSQLKMRDGPGSFSYFYAGGGKIGFLDNTFNYAAYSERSTGNWIVQNGDVKAERFVDNDAPTYFLHPGGTDSYIKRLTTENSVIADQITIGGDIGSRTIKTTDGALTIDASGGISLDGNGNSLDVNNVKIVNLVNPTNDQDAATKSYVDAVAQGLRVIPAALAATTGDLNATFASDTLTIAATETLNIDGVTSWGLGDRLLVKDQTAERENGSYELTQLGDASTDWIFTRGEYFNETSEIPGAFQFVVDGTNNAGTGWVATVADAETFTLNTDTIIWYQFSGAGTYSAGESLTLDGTEFSIADGDIPNVKLANPQINIAGEAGANTIIALGETLTITGTNGVDTTISNGEVAIAVNVLDGGTF
jgi:hypothetical protein